MRSVVLAIAALSAHVAAYAADPPPAWLTEAAAQAVKSYPPKVTTAVLLAEEHLTVDDAGLRSMRERGAVRILSGRGAGLRASRHYNAKSGKIRSFQAWLIRPGGKTEFYGKDRVVDVAAGQDSVYTESRARIIECGAAEDGSVFGWEVVEEESTIFTTYPYRFQERDPVERARFILTLPPAWEVRSTVFNHANIEPQIAGNTYTWEIRDLPWIEEEEYSVGWHALAPLLGVTYWPKAGAAPDLRPLSSWEAVSSWMARFSEPAVEVTPAIEAKARALAQGADSEWARIRAIAEYVQKVNYISVQLNLNRGGGYTPNPAGKILERNYGDCKDKVTLMRALLKAIGIQSHSVSVYSGSRNYVRKEWPSPQQFNHAIIAVKVNPDVAAPTVVQHEKAGRLLLFDVTDSVTPLGGLDDDEQGSWAMLDAEQGGLFRLPLLGAHAGRIERRTEAAMNDEGAAIAVMQSIYHGHSATTWKLVQKQLGAEEVRKRWERILSRRSGGVTVATVKAEDKGDTHTATVEYTLRQLGKLMQGRLLIVTPGILTPETQYIFASKERREPIELKALSHRDVVVIKMPEGFTLDELPDAIEQNGEFGQYRAAWRVQDGLVLFEQRLLVNDAVVEVKDYARLKNFFDEVGRARTSPVVLLKK